VADSQEGSEVCDTAGFEYVLYLEFDVALGTGVVKISNEPDYSAIAYYAPGVLRACV
jgi:hypothetical protein